MVVGAWEPSGSVTIPSVAADDQGGRPPSRVRYEPDVPTAFPPPAAPVRRAASRISTIDTLAA
jgi:hypothetical protein